MIFRSDNRSPEQMRPVNIVPDFISTAEGSCLIELGNTRVICTATIEDSVPQFLRNSGKGWVTAEYAMLPRSTLTRTPREANKGRAAVARTKSSGSSAARCAPSPTWRSWESAPSSSTATSSRPTAAPARRPSPERSSPWDWPCGAWSKSGTMTVAPIRDYVAATSIGIVDGEIMLDLLRRRLARRRRHEHRGDRQQED